MVKIPRNPRNFLKSSFFHVITQGIDKENIFKEKRYKEQYINLLRKAIKEVDVKIKSYCIMDNHAHLLCSTNNVKNISKLMQKVNTSYAKYYNYMENGRVGYVFKGRFLSEPIDSKRYLINCIKYIHLNPVKAHMVLNCEEYKYSSYNYYKKRINNKNHGIKDDILTRKDYIDICNNTYTSFTFIDIEKNIKEKILQGISEYIEKEHINVARIFINRNTLINLIKFLKNVRKINYCEVRKELEISRGTMETITEAIRNEKRKKFC